MSRETIYPQSVEFRASVVLESRREVDYFEYQIRLGKLYSKVTGSLQPVENSITTRNGTEKIEKKGFDKIQLWAVYSDSGSCVWVSPPARSDLSAKAVISEIATDPIDGKILTNRNICFDWDENMFLHFAEYCGRFDIKNGEDLRGKPIFLSNDEKHKLYELLEQLEPLQIKQVQTGDDIRNKEELKAKLASGSHVSTGGHAPSCPPSPFEVFSGETFPCPSCLRPIKKGLGITTCPHCGAKKENYKSACD